MYSDYSNLTEPAVHLGVPSSRRATGPQRHVGSRSSVAAQCGAMQFGGRIQIHDTARDQTYIHHATARAGAYF